MKKFIITGYATVEERDSKNQMHGIIVIEGGEEMKIIEVKEEEKVTKLTIVI